LVELTNDQFDEVEIKEACFGAIPMNSEGGRPARDTTCASPRNRPARYVFHRTRPEHSSRRFVPSIIADQHCRSAILAERAKVHSASQIQIDPALIERFGRMMRENFSTGSVPFRKAYLQSLIESIEVDDSQVRIEVDDSQVRIRGSSKNVSHEPLSTGSRDC
jgi:hypothetical protein